jgi:hypothetical protein
MTHLKWNDTMINLINLISIKFNLQAINKKYHLFNNFKLQVWNSPNKRGLKKRKLLKKAFPKIKRIWNLITKHTIS